MTKKSENFKVKIGEGFPVERALRKFKRMCDSYGVVKVYRAKQAYTKPSLAKVEKREAAEKRRRKTAAKSKSYSRKI